MDELQLDNEHLVFEQTTLDSDIKCSEVVAAININKVTPEIIATTTELLRDTMLVHDLQCAMATSDAAGCNWVAFKDILSTHTIRDILSNELLDEYPKIDFDLMTVAQDPVTEEYFIFLPDMPHLSKCLGIHPKAHSIKCHEWCVQIRYL